MAANGAKLSNPQPFVRNDGKVTGSLRKGAVVFLMSRRMD